VAAFTRRSGAEGTLLGRDPAPHHEILRPHLGIVKAASCIKTSRDAARCRADRRPSKRVAKAPHPRDGAAQVAVPQVAGIEPLRADRLRPRSKPQFRRLRNSCWLEIHRPCMLGSKIPAGSVDRAAPRPVIAQAGANRYGEAGCRPASAASKTRLIPR